MAFRPFFVILVSALLGLPTLGGAASEDLAATPQLRRPVALAVNGSSLYVANRAGSISILDRVSGDLLGEIKIGKRLADLKLLPGHHALLAVDEDGGQLIRLELDAGLPRVAARLSIGFSPASVCVAPNGTSCSVALLWAHRVAIVELGSGDFRVQGVIDLPFAPRRQCLSPDGKTLIVADSFGGNLALIDLPSRKLRSLRSLQAHNIRGLTFGADGDLLISHQVIEERIPTIDSNIFWGGVVANLLQAVTWHELTDPPDAPGPRRATPIGHWSMYALGDPGYAAGDPGELLVLGADRWAIALSGVNEIAVGPQENGNFLRLPVGRDPTALAVSDDRKTLFVANTFEDSISFVDLTNSRVTATVPLGPEPQLTSAQRGEILFHDSRFSRDGWYSCNSCHTDGHTCGLRNDNFSDGSFGTPKRILSLMGAGQTGPWAWNASNKTLEEQIHKSILSTMDGKPVMASKENVEALAAYVRTLPPPPSLLLARGQIDAVAVARGRRVFQEMDCTRCHAPPTYTSPETYDVGLTDEAGLKRFNPPSLLGVSQLPAYFHDNRADTLGDVFVRFKHPDGQEISGRRLEDLLAFLESL